MEAEADAHLDHQVVHAERRGEAEVAHDSDSELGRRQVQRRREEAARVHEFCRKGARLLEKCCQSLTRDRETRRRTDARTEPLQHMRDWLSMRIMRHLCTLYRV